MKHHQISKTIDFRDYLDFSYNKSIIISSDYSEEHLGSKYYTYTFTFQTFSTLEKWHEETKQLKKKKKYVNAPSYKKIRTVTKKRKKDRKPYKI